MSRDIRLRCPDTSQCVVAPPPPPLAKPIATVTVEQQLECGRMTRVLTFKPAANGSFNVRIKVPAAAKAGIYRLMSTVRESTGSRRGFATYSLPLPVVLG